MSSCIWENDKKYNIEYAQYLCIKSNVKMPLCTDSIMQIRTYYDPAYKDILYFISQNHNLYLYFILSNQIEKLKTNHLNINDVFIKNLDSIYVLSDNEILLMDKQGDIKHIIEIKTNNEVLSAGSLFPFYIIDSLAFMFRFPKDVINSYSSYQTFISTSREFCYDLKNKKEFLLKNAGNYPSYLKKDFKYLFNPFRIIDTHYNLIYSFETNDTICIFNILSKRYEKKIIRSKYFQQNSTFNFNDIHNYEKINKYLIENSRYYLLYHDNYVHLYYRIILHKYHYKDKNTINLRTDVPWSIVVCDSNFNTLKEIKFNAKEYFFWPFIMTNQGVLLRKQGYENTYSLFNFSH